MTEDSVLVYRNCRPYYKFTLPAQEPRSLELDAWASAQVSTDQLASLLQVIAGEIGLANLSVPSQLLLATPPVQRQHFLSRFTKKNSIMNKVLISAFTTLSKSIADERGVTCLVLATETAEIYIMDPETFTVTALFQLGETPYLVGAAGSYGADWSVAAALRDGMLVLVGPLGVTPLAHLPSSAISLTLAPNAVISAHADGSLQGHSYKGRRQWRTELIGRPVGAVVAKLAGRGLDLLAVALPSGVALYDGPRLLHISLSTDPVSALTFGSYGHEEHALITVHSSGALRIKLLKRTAQFTGVKKPMNAVANSQDIKLLIPKKSKLIIEQTLRERHSFREMHGWLMMSLLGLTVASGQNYLSSLNSASTARRENIKLALQVVGLGPRMKLRMTLENMSKTILPTGIAITFICDPKIYHIHRPYIPIATLTGGVSCRVETWVSCQLPISGIIHVLLVSSTVILSATVNMPPSANILM